MARRPLEREGIYLDRGRRTTQLMRDSLGSPLEVTMIAVIFATILSSTSLQQQGSQPSVRDSVTHVVDQLAHAGGNFVGSLALGEFDGDKTPFRVLDALFESKADSVLLTLVDCFTDSTATRIRLRNLPITRGGLCYILLRNLVYRETDPDEHWPGNFVEHPTPRRLRAAQRAWREAVHRHWYSPA